MIFESLFHISAAFSTCVVARFKVPFLRVVPVILVDDAVLFIALNYRFRHDFYQWTGGWNDKKFRRKTGTTSSLLKL